MRGYPIGIALLWETYEDIQYRYFMREYIAENLYSYHWNSRKKKLKVVLDGQQRLQSLYIALYGKYENRFLYFDILSGKESENIDNEKYIFKFMTPKEAEDENKFWAELTEKEKEDYQHIDYFVKVTDIYEMSISQKKDLVEKVTKDLKLPKTDFNRGYENFAKFDKVITENNNIFQLTVIDEDFPKNSRDRKSEMDVLEIFVRVNQEGTELTRSDLIFSLLKLNWKESSEALPKFIKKVNKGNSFEIDNDFVIRCLFAVSDMGSRLDIDLLRNRNNVEKLRKNFESCCDAIRSLIDFVIQECRCQSSDLIGGYNTLVPFVYYLFHIKNYDVRNDQVANVRKALYLISFARPFSRYADSRIGPFIRKVLAPLVEDKNNAFPLDETISQVVTWERIKNYDDLLQKNVDLTLHLVQDRTGAKFQYIKNAPQIDHIFPRAELRKKEFDESLINHYANFWILAKSKNLNKSASNPRIYFKDADKTTLAKALIEKDMLKYSQYKSFIQQRKEIMIKKIKKILQLNEKDFLNM